MKQFIIKLKEAIKRGLLRIFPLPQKAFYIALALTALLLIGCSTPRQVTQLVRDTRVDTLYLSNVQYDSIYIYHDHIQTDTILHSPSKGEMEGVLIKDVSVEYRYKLLKDTIRVVERDSIPYQVTVVETKEITRPLTLFDKICRTCFFFLLGALITFLCIRFKRVL